MSKLTYNGIAYKQSSNPKSPWIVNFVSSSEDLLEWVGIPRRSEKGLVGFQRVDDEARIRKAKAFFEDNDLNQSPTALIVGIHKPLTPDNRMVTLQFLDEGDDGSGVRPCKITIDFDSLPEETQDIKETIKNQISVRLQESEQDYDDPDSADEDLTINSEDLEESDHTTDEEGSSEEEIEIGRSLLKSLLENLESDDWIEENKTDLKDFAKPATLIDGQHRAKGAELCERNIPFSVCAIFDCPWPEQVFQFTVVNYTQKGIPDQFITANAALSLTGQELDELQDRLVQANVKVIEYELMRVVNFDQGSPFYNLVNLSEKKQQDKIGYKTMVQVAKRWYQGKNDAVKQIIDNIYPDVKGKKKEAVRIRIERWQKEDWGRFFKAFWGVVYNNFKGAKTKDGYDLWAVGYSNLMIAVVLLELQEAFLTNLGHQDESFFEVKDADDPVGKMVEKTENRAQKFVQYVPADLFAREWGTKSLNTGAGRQALKECIRNMVDRKGSFSYAKSTLVTGSTEKSS